MRRLPHPALTNTEIYFSLVIKCIIDIDWTYPYGEIFKSAFQMVEAYYMDIKK